MNIQTMFRAALIVAVSTAAGTAAWRLARVDSDLGAATGPDRLIAQFDQQAGTGPQDKVRAFEILHDRPVDGAAFRILGGIADASGESVTAANFYRIAASRNPRDPIVRGKLVEYSLASGRMAESARHLDALLRVSPATGQPVLQGMVRLLSDEALRIALVGRLALDPPWRPLLPATLSTAPDPASAEALLALLATASSPRPDEVALRVSLLERLGRPLAAHNAWRAALPTDAKPFDGLIFDGGFEYGEGPEPYGWRLRSPVGAAVGLDKSRPARGLSSLALVFGGRSVDFSGVSQDMVLQPGKYLLTLQADLALIANERSFAWSVACRGTDQELGRMELPAQTDGWQGFSLSFEVPVACPTQRLALLHDGRNLRERQLSGRIAFDALDLRLQPR